MATDEHDWDAVCTCVIGPIMQDLSQFREPVLAALYGNYNIFQLVTNYVEKLSISHRNPNAPKTCMDLVLRAERVYNLL
jgi:hypothetical protein